jgi:hypothetical protein
MVNGKKPMAYLVDKRIYLPSGMKIVSDGLDSDQLSIGPNQVGSNEHHYLSLDLIWPFFMSRRSKAHAFFLEGMLNRSS